jgi:hypothetical protein
MKRRIITSLCWIILTGAPVLAQETLYPVRSSANIGTVFSADRSSFVVEKAFAYKMTLGFPSSDSTWFLPNSHARIVLMWMRIENLSDQPLDLNPATFTSTGDDGRAYPVLTPDEGFNRILAEAGDKFTFGTNALHSLSLGKAGTPPTEEELRADMRRYSLQPSRIPSHDIREGLIYFESPPAKRFTVSIRLGDLWSKPFSFTNVKQK